MERGGSVFRWIRKPQLLVGALVLCFCISALGSISRSAYDSTNMVKQEPVVKGVAAPIDCSLMPCLALTFDDGPHASVTLRVLDALRRNQARATFFMVGKQVVGKEHIVRQAYADGNEIGNHSWDHTDFRKLSPADIEVQVKLTQSAIAAAGVPAPKVIRPPYGAVDPMILGHLHMAVIGWNIDPLDWKLHDPQAIYDNVLASVRPGGIVLMHDIDPATADALEPILQVLKQQYQLVTVSELLQLTRGDQGQYFNR